MLYCWHLRQTWLIQLSLRLAHMWAPHQEHQEHTQQRVCIVAFDWCTTTVHCTLQGWLRTLPNAVFISVENLGFFTRLSNRFCFTKSAAFGPPCPGKHGLSYCEGFSRVHQFDNTQHISTHKGYLADLPSKTPKQPTVSPVLGSFLNCITQS